MKHRHIKHKLSNLNPSIKSKRTESFININYKKIEYYKRIFYETYCLRIIKMCENKRVTDIGWISINIYAHFYSKIDLVSDHSMQFILGKIVCNIRQEMFQ